MADDKEHNVREKILTTQYDTEDTTGTVTATDMPTTQQDSPEPVSSTSQYTPPSDKNEDESLAFINEQLSFLNSASGELATTIHLSNKQVRLDIAKKSRDSGMRRRELYRSPIKRFNQIQGRGVKRSPGKLSLSQPKVARKSLDTKSASEGINMLSDEGKVSDEPETSDDEDCWRILEESDAETPINEALDENAFRSNLTASNVKKLLHQVITNEHVVAMVKNTLMADKEKFEAHYEPKMTRSKVKHIIQEEGDVLHPWPLSPLKNTKRPGASFLEVEFPEDEEDDEYDPSKEPDPVSDEDSESMTSSQVSDIGSPVPTTPRTPRSCERLSVSDLSTTPTTGEGLSPMGPPSQKHLLGKKYQDAMATTDRTEDETIALRTRSKLSLTETTLTELESTFVAPDITADMYDTECDDNDWQTFLTSLVKPCETEDTNDGCDEEDPEYDYLEDAAKSQVDREDLRSDRAVQVSKKEMHELMDELFDVYEDMELEDKEKQKMKKMARNNLIKSHKKPRRVDTVVSSSGPGALRMTESERLQVEDQMRKHVQLLSQLYIMAQSSQDTHGSVAADSVFLLKEIKCFASSSSLVSPHRRSVFYAYNLDLSLRLVSEVNEWEQSKPPENKPVSPEKSLTSLLSRHYSNLSKDQKDRILEVVDKGQGNGDLSDPGILPCPKSTLPALTRQQVDTFLNSEVFLYSSMLPVGGFDTSVPKVKQRITFTEAEDNLLALGYDQFSAFPLHRELIQKFLLPCKTPEQIKIRIKNLSASKIGDNVIKQLKRTKCLPVLPQFGLDWDESQVKPLKDQSVNSDFPYWYKEMRIKEIIGTSGEVAVGGRVKRARSVNIPIRTRKGGQGKSRLRKSQSVPATPADPDLLDSSSMGSVFAVRHTSLDTDLIKAQDDDPGLEDVLPVDSPLPRWKKLLQQSARKSPSPGFISLYQCSGMESDGHPASPINVRRMESVYSPASVRSPAPPSTPGTPQSQFSVQEQITPQKSDLVKLLPASPIVIVQGGASATCATPTILVVSRSGNVSVAGQRITPVKVVSSLDRVVSSVLMAKPNVSAAVPSTVDTPPRVPGTPPSAGVMTTPPSVTRNLVGDMKTPPSAVMNLHSGETTPPATARSNVAIGTTTSPCVRGMMTSPSATGNIVIGMTTSPSVSGNVVRGMTTSPSVSGNVVRGMTTSPSVSGNVVRGMTTSPSITRNIVIGMTTSPSVSGNVVRGMTTSPSVSGNVVRGMTTSPSVSGNVVGGITNSPSVVGGITNSPSATGNIVIGMRTPPGNKVLMVQNTGTNTDKSHTISDSPASLLSPSNLQGQSTPENVCKPRPLPAKSALEIVASYAPFIYSPLRSDELSPEKFSALNQLSQERTPTKSSAFVPRFRPVAPNPFSTSPVQTVSPFLGKDKSPRRKQLTKKAQAICPKGFVLKSYVSPSKKAASNIVHRVLKRNVPRILPRHSPRNELQITVRPSDLFKKKSNHMSDEADEEKMSKSEYDTLESEYLSDDNDDSGICEKSKEKLERSGGKIREKTRQKEAQMSRVESDIDTQSENEDGDDSQNDDEEDMDDEDHMAELMAASSRIGFAQKKAEMKDKNRSKAKKRKDSTLAMLAPDLLDMDPQKDDRDTAFAQAYLCRAREILKDDMDTYESFLKLLYDFGKIDFSPVKLYGELRGVLKDYPDLVTDFAGFLLPEQAVECGCYMTTQEFIRARTFLRKLEVHFVRHPAHFQKCLKVLWAWSQKPSQSAKELKSALEPLLKGQTHLLHELSLLFKEERPPESYLTDYEEITLGDSDEDFDFDGYEEVELPDEEDISGTKKCQCRCHNNPLDTNYFKRNKHCYSCCLKVIDGELFFRVNTKVLKKVKVIFHKPIKARSGNKEEEEEVVKEEMPCYLGNEEWYEDDTAAAEKENMDISLLEDLPRPKSMNKMKISLKKKAKGRFMTLNEIVESPLKGSPKAASIRPRLDSPMCESPIDLPRSGYRTPTSDIAGSSAVLSNGAEPSNRAVMSLFGITRNVTSSTQDMSTEIGHVGESPRTLRQGSPDSDIPRRQVDTDKVDSGTRSPVLAPFSRAEPTDTSLDMDVSCRSVNTAIPPSTNVEPTRLPVRLDLSGHDVHSNKPQFTSVQPVGIRQPVSISVSPPDPDTQTMLQHQGFNLPATQSSPEEKKHSPPVLFSPDPLRLDVMMEDASLSPQKRMIPVTNLLRLEGEFGSPSKDSTCSDILAKAVRSAMIGQGDISMDSSMMEGESQSNILAKAVRSAMIGQGDISMDSSMMEGESQSNILAKAVKSAMIGQGDIAMDISVMEGESQSNILAKAVRSTMIGQGDIPMDISVREGESSGRIQSSILSKALKAAMIGEEDVSMDSSFLDDSKNVLKTESDLTLELSSDSAFSVVSCRSREVGGPDATSVQVSQDNVTDKPSTHLPPDTTGTRTDIPCDKDESTNPSACTGSVEPDLPNSESLSENKGGEFFPTTDDEGSRSVSPASPASQDLVASSGFRDEERRAKSDKHEASSVCSSDDGSRSQDWSREVDRQILEYVKENGPSPETFDDLAQQLGNKTGTEVLKRFQHMLELLTDAETASDNDTSSSSRSSEFQC